MDSTTGVFHLSDALHHLVVGGGGSLLAVRSPLKGSEIANMTTTAELQTAAILFSRVDVVQISASKFSFYVTISGEEMSRIVVGQDGNPKVTEACVEMAENALEVKALLTAPSPWLSLADWDSAQTSNSESKVTTGT